MKHRWKLWTAAGILALSAVGCVDRASQAQAKETEKFVSDPVKVVTAQPVELKAVSEIAEITGELTSGLDTTINARTQGKIVAVYVKDGDAVSAGQVIARQDTSTLDAQLQQAFAQLSSANAALAQAQANLTQAKRNAKLGPSKTSASVKSAEAQLRSVQAQLQKALNGSRPEELAQAESNVANAKVNLETQKRELDRVTELVKEGAIAGNRLDQQLSVYQSALTQYNNTLEALKIAKNATRSEDIEVLRQSVAQAQENLRTAQTQKDLDPLLQDQVNAAQAAVASAQAQAASARAQIQIAKTAIEDATIRAPFAGRISGKPIQAGSVPGNGVAIARLISNDGLYFEGEVPSGLVDKVRAGMSVGVTLDSQSGPALKGTVAAVNPQADTVGRIFKTRILLTGALNGVHSGMFARGKITLQTINDATVVPAVAVLGLGSDRSVFVIEGGVAKRKPVTLGLTQGSLVQIKGVSAGEQVIVKGQESLVEGAKVRSESAKVAAKSETVGG